MTVTSSAFAAAFEPLHVYVELGASLAAPVAGTGKEYAGLVPALPFTPTHLIAVRRVGDGGAGPYDGVFLPDAGFMTRERARSRGPAMFTSSDNRTLSVAVPWTALGGCPTTMRLSAHVVHAVAANECWKEGTVPASATPWLAAGGGYYESDLTVTPVFSLR